MILLADGPPGDLATAGGWPKPRPEAAQSKPGPVRPYTRAQTGQVRSGQVSESELLANAMLELEKAAAGSGAVRSAKGGAKDSKRQRGRLRRPGCAWLPPAEAGPNCGRDRQTYRQSMLSLAPGIRQAHQYVR